MKSIKDYILIFIIAMLAIFSGYQWWRASQADDVIKDYKRYVIERDTLIEVSKGQYKKIVDDTKSIKELNQTLKNRNEELFEVIEEQNKDIVSLIEITQSFKSKTDTVYVESDNSFIDYYPSKQDPFVQYTSRYVSSNKRIGEWSLSDINIDLVISEKMPGLFEADLKGPSFLKISSLQVESLPLENVNPDNFGWLLGGSLDYNWTDQSPAVDLYGGVRVKKTNIFLKAGTDATLGVGLIKEF